jgi:hypothetical protein
MRTHSWSAMIAGVCGVVGSAAHGQTHRAVARPAAGYVVDVSGAWTASSRRRPLALGDSVLSGDTIRVAAHPAGGQRISVVVRGTDALQATCEFATSPAAAPRCPPLVIPSSSRTAAESFSRVMISAVGLFRSHGERRYASLVSRGAGGALADAVVPLRGDAGDLSAAFVGLDSGRYVICLRPIASDNAGDDANATECAVRTERQWPAAAGATLPVDGLRAGLYEVRVGSRRAWVWRATSARSTRAAPTSRA